MIVDSSLMEAQLTILQLYQLKVYYPIDGGHDNSSNTYCKCQSTQRFLAYLCSSPPFLHPDFCIQVLGA